jgi:hypothetical protein
MLSTLFTKKDVKKAKVDQPIIRTRPAGRSSSVSVAELDDEFIMSSQILYPTIYLQTGSTNEKGKPL